MAGRHDETAPRPLRRSDLSVHEIDGEAVAFDPSSGAVHRLNETALLVWRACDGTRGVEAIADELGGRLELGRAQLRAEVDRTVALLGQSRLLENDTSVAAGVLAGRRLQPQDDSPTSTTGRGRYTRTRPAAQVETNVPQSGDSLSSAEHSGRRPLPDGRGSAQRRGMANDCLVSRRDLLRSGATKAVLAAPIVSTFFASGAYASGPSASAAFGAGQCKTIGYSCTTIADCCVTTQKGKCQSSTCCLNGDETGCDSDADCCDANACVAGTCQ